jgi:hypothetical protein
MLDDSSRLLDDGAGVGIDFHADGDLNDTRLSPEHLALPSRTLGPIGL